MAHLANLQVDEGLQAARHGVEVATASAHHARLLSEIYLGWALVEAGQRAEASLLDSVTNEALNHSLRDIAVPAIMNNVWMHCFSLRAAEAGPVMEALSRDQLQPAGSVFFAFVAPWRRRTAEIHAG